jgi:hypothetical protein
MATRLTRATVDVVLDEVFLDRGRGFASIFKIVLACMKYTVEFNAWSYLAIEHRFEFRDLLEQAVHERDVDVAYRDDPGQALGSVEDGEAAIGVFAKSGDGEG